MEHQSKSNKHKNSDIQKIGKNWQDYRPLIIVILFSVILPLAHNKFHFSHFPDLMYDFMGYFFLFLSMFKLFDLKGFIEGFSTYDLIARKIRIYGYLYPFIELSLGLAYLAKLNLHLVNLVTLVVMMLSGLGVMKTISSGQKVKCACLGNILNVPLSTVSILENFGMGAMAAYQAFA